MKIKNSYIDLSISIVSYNTRELLKRCIESIYKYTKGIDFEVIVVDNASQDGTADMVEREFKKVKLIKNIVNKYYTGANNQSLNIAKGKYFLILNADTYFVDNSLKKMVDYMEENLDIGACEGLEVYEDGRLVPTGSRFSTPLIDFYELSLIGIRLKNEKLIDWYRYKKKARRDTFEIDVGCDAFLIVRKNILLEIGGYDENFLLYYTENDLCLRIKKLGCKIMHIGSAKVIHRVSASVNKLGWRKTDIYYKDLLWYYRKHGYVQSGTILYILLKLEERILKIIKYF